MLRCLKRFKWQILEIFGGSTASGVVAFFQMPHPVPTAHAPAAIARPLASAPAKPAVRNVPLLARRQPRRAERDALRLRRVANAPSPGNAVVETHVNAVVAKQVNNIFTTLVILVLKLEAIWNHHSIHAIFMIN